jgi:hypothetical protein
LRPIPNADPSTIAYGFLPPRLFNHVRERFVALVKSRKAKRVTRTDYAFIFCFAGAPPSGRARH